MHLNKIIALATLISFVSCDPIGPGGYKYNQGSLPESPVNLEAFNSPYDDYNSTAPSFGRLIPFCFSTNRNSMGTTFDVMYQPMNVNFDRTSGILKVTNEYSNWGIYSADFEIIKNALNKINTDDNEFGPNLFLNRNSSDSGFDFLLMYATDVSGNFEISYTFNKDKSDFTDSKPVKFLNSGSDDLYPTFTSDQSQLYFCSDRENGNFNIFYVNIDNTSKDMNMVLSDVITKEVFKDETLSGDYDDKCPYIFAGMMVFTSNRPGGFGGFDLYYSQLEYGKWSTPTNFGSKINTEFDEYRPILFESDVDFERHMMVFSSNRTGGKGGFDLYFVGVKKDV